MTQWLAGMKVTADRLNDGVSPTQITTGMTAQSGFTMVSFSAYKVGHEISFYALVSNTSTITPTGVNITDTNVAALPTGWWPLDQVNGTYGNGTADGEFIIAASGMLQIRTANAALTSGGNLRFSKTFVYAL